MQDAIIEALAAIVGLNNLLTTPEERWGYAYDATDRAAMPDLVVFPGSAAEVAAIVRLANEHRFPVAPRYLSPGPASYPKASPGRRAPARKAPPQEEKAPPEAPGKPSAM